VPDLNHLWQRFLLASALVVGLALGAAATIFGYSNPGSVNVHWSVFHIDGVPLWTVAVVPLGLVIIAGTIYHWMDGLHHFTEHMRHRRRVHELEAELASLRAHLDQVLEMPDHSTSKLPAKRASAASLPPADEGIVDPVHADVADIENAKPAPASIEPAVENPTPARKGDHRGSQRRATLTAAGEAGEPDSSGSQVEGMAAGGKATEPAVSPAAEV
jgi:hypothetical protein